jgi:L-threonylcarbamoyladenylate synthase
VAPMAIVSARGDPAPAAAIAAAVRALAAGDIVGIPTDTVYGLAADAFHSGASDRLFAVKRRPRTVELPVLVADVAQALSLTIAVPASARRLMDRFWPGALTLVLPRRPDLNADLGDDDATIGMRCPAHPVPLALCAEVGPLATTSANRHGEPPATTAAALEAALGPGVELILDAGPCSGMASTVVDCTGVEPRMLREGGLSWDEILAVAVD